MSPNTLRPNSSSNDDQSEDMLLEIADDQIFSELQLQEQYLLQPPEHQQNSSPNTLFPNSSNDDQSEDMLLEIADNLIFSELQLQEQYLLQPPEHQQNSSLLQASFTEFPGSRNDARNSTRGGSNRVIFRTKSELEVLEDGYKWRKYGKKTVKNSPHPRNYYQCSYEGCNVKRRVERDREDSSYIITTYDGIHNHPVPPSATGSRSSI